MPTTPVIRKIGGQEPDKSSGMKMPHERDESSSDAKEKKDLEPVQSEQMEQARKDMEGPQQDTDCYAMPQPDDSACAQPDIVSQPASELMPDIGPKADPSGVANSRSTKGRKGSTNR
jgi:hypothetical protein